MKMCKVKINGQILSNSKYKTITAESVGIDTVSFEFDDSWNGLSIFACFKNPSIEQEYHIKISEPYEVKIPWEVMSVCGVVYIGALGLKGEDVVKPTIWRAVADVVQGVSPNGIIPKEATPNVVAQITEIANNAVNIAQSVRDDADAGKFGGGGGSGNCDSLKDEIKQEILEELGSMQTLEARIGYATLLADKWSGVESPYSQIVIIDGVTKNTQVDLTPSAEQLNVFYNKDLAFVTENNNGTVTVYAIGQKPQNDYTIQVTLTEVSK